VRLHAIPARSPDLVASELLIAIASYNLIRAVMAEAAQQINTEPRRLSFSRSRGIVLGLCARRRSRRFEGKVRISLASAATFPFPMQTAKTPPTTCTPSHLA
jgi:hypothetical protein